jgi:AcrR family transcriptional regulator
LIGSAAATRAARKGGRRSVPLLSAERGRKPAADEPDRPSGLRQRKKENRRKEILRVASELFRKHGYPSTSMEAIAQAADISPNTIYNYFRTKGQLLIAMIAASDESFLAKYSAQESDPDDAIESMFNFLEALAKHSLGEIDRNTWKHAIAQTMVREGNEDISGDIGDINKRLVDVMEASIALLKQQGYLRPSTRPESLASMLFDFHRILFIRLIVDENIRWKSYRAILRSYVVAGLTREAVISTCSGAK